MQLLLPRDNTGLLPISYFHALARLGQEGLVLVEPSQSFVSLGYFDAKETVDLAYCREQGIPVMRRETGGGMVLLGPGQVFYTLVMRRPHPPIPNGVQDAYRHLSQAPVAVYGRMGIRARLRPINDIVTEQGHKIGGQGAADINGHFCFVGSILLDFDHDLMHRIVRLSDPRLKVALKGALASHMTSIRRETGHTPSADRIKEYLIQAFRPLVGGLEMAPVSDALLREARLVTKELAASVHEDDEPRSRPLFKIQEGLYLCQRVVATPPGPIALSISIRDDIVVSVRAIAGADRDVSAWMKEWTGARFAADTLPLCNAARCLGITTDSLIACLFGPPDSAGVTPGIAE